MRVMNQEVKTEKVSRTRCVKLICDICKKEAEHSDSQNWGEGNFGSKAAETDQDW